MFLDEVSDHLGVGFGCELMSFFRKLALQCEIILDDAVVGNDDPSVTITMRMGIFFGWAAVRRPTCVPQTELAANGLLLKEFFEILQLSRTAANVKFLILNDRYAGRVVAAVFERFEAA